ncbi:VapE domain-containing protein [Cyanobium sp. ULC065]
MLLGKVLNIDGGRWAVVSLTGGFAGNSHILRPHVDHLDFRSAARRQLKRQAATLAPVLCELFAKVRLWVHTCLVSASEAQGIGKSEFWKILGGEWFSDSLGDLRDIREDRIQLHSAWIHEWGEIDNIIGKRESETLKRFVSCSQVDCRRPYGRGVEHLKRSCGLVGTTNRRDFMKDPTGNRRLPVIHIQSVALPLVRANRDRI